MSDYSKVSHAALSSIAQRCLNELPNKEITKYKTTFSGSGVMTSDIKKKVNGILDDITKEKSLVGNIKTLQFNLNKLLNAAGKIEEYQDLKEEISDFARYMDDDSSSDRRRLKRMKQKLKNLGEEIDRNLEKKQGWFD